MFRLPLTVCIAALSLLGTSCSWSVEIGGSKNENASDRSPSPSDNKDNDTVGGGSELPSGSCDRMNVPAGCEADMCRAYQCGAATSMFDADGCIRKSCKADTDCGSKERCQEVNRTQGECTGPDPNTGRCTCGSVLAILKTHVCVAVQDGSSPSESCDKPNFPGCEAEVCRTNRCGAADSVFDKDGCYRLRCETDADCDEKEQCRDVVYAPVACSGVDPGTNKCTCGWLNMEMRGRMCMPRP